MLMIIVKEGHGGMDWLVFCDFIKSVQDQTDVPIDVYDLAAWMSISALADVFLHGPYDVGLAAARLL